MAWLLATTPMKTTMYSPRLCRAPFCCAAVLQTPANSGKPRQIQKIPRSNFIKKCLFIIYSSQLSCLCLLFYIIIIP